MNRVIRAAVIVAVLAMIQAQTRAALVAYYTLDDTQATNGLKNGGTGGTSYDLALSSLSGANTSATVVSTGIIGGKALRFAGSTAYQASGHPSGYPFTFSLWVANVPNGTASTAAMALTQTASSNRYFSLGVSSTETANGARRNGTSNTFNTSTGPSLADGAWHNLVGVFSSDAAYSIYVDGQFGATQTDDVPFDNLFNALLLGGIIRSNTGFIAPYSGDLDDAGTFDTALTGADVALINGLGQTGGVGLNWLGAAQSINAAAVGSSGTIDGVQWQHVTGLSGAVGAWGGSVAGGDAFIVTGTGGEGIEVVPEPGAAGLVVLAMGLAFARRHRRQEA